MSRLPKVTITITLGLFLVASSARADRVTLDVPSQKLTGLMPFATKDGSPALVQVELFSGVRGSAARDAIVARLRKMTPVDASAPPLDPKGRVLPNGDWVGEQALKTHGLRIPVTKVRKSGTHLDLSAYTLPLGWAGAVADPTLKVVFEDRVLLVKEARRDTRLAKALAGLPGDAVLAVRVATNNPLMGFSHLKDSSLSLKGLVVPGAAVDHTVVGPKKAPPLFELGALAKGLLGAPKHLPKATAKTAFEEGAKIAGHGLKAMGHMMTLRPDRAVKETVRGMFRFWGAPLRAVNRAAYGRRSRARR